MHPKSNLYIFADIKVSDIIYDNTFYLLMLEHFGIGLALQEKTIQQICLENKINIDLFLTIANLFNGFNPSPDKDYSFSDTHTIINYLKKSHDYYLNEKYPQIRNYIEKIYALNKHSDIVMVEKFFDKYFKEVTEHLNYENQIAFPYIIDLLNRIEQKNVIPEHNYSIIEYKEHHNDIEEELTDLKNLLIKYLPQNNDHQIRRNLLFSLVELEYDLTIHTQIENLILVPLVEKMEQLVNQKK